MAYIKPWKSYEDQLEMLISRGMAVANRAIALDYLERIGYYRLSGYWYPFRERSGDCCILSSGNQKKKNKKTQTLALDSFKPGVTFQHAVQLYVFDKQLRLLALDALERIEIALRVDLSHTLGRLDQFAYLKPELFHDDFSQRIDQETGVTKLHTWLGKHGQLINRSKEEFVRHNKDRYGLPLAIWVACEVWDFGTMSTLFSGMRESEQDAIASQYGISNGRVFASWLRSLNYLRNVSAHHSRLWNRNMVDQPKLPAVSEVAWVAPFVSDDHARARCFLLLRIARHLIQEINPGSTWPARMKQHIQGFPHLAAAGVTVAGMGTVANWDADW